MEMLQQVFEGQQLGVFEDQGEVWFRASEVAKLLGYRNAPDMTRRLDEDEKGTRSVRTPGGVQEVTVINEPGVYRAIFASRREEAERFKRWLAHDLLPTLRRTGFYSMREAVVTPHAIARAYGVATKNVPYYMEHHQIHPVGHAENPDTGKLVAVYPRQPVLEQFMLGGGMRQGFELRAYSGAWEKVRPALAE